MKKTYLCIAVFFVEGIYEYPSVAHYFINLDEAGKKRVEKAVANEVEGVVFRFVNAYPAAGEECLGSESALIKALIEQLS